MPRMTVFAEGRYAAFNPMEDGFVERTIPYNQSIALVEVAPGHSAFLSPHRRMFVYGQASTHRARNIWRLKPTVSLCVAHKTRASLGMQIAGGAVSKILSGSVLRSTHRPRNDSTVGQYDYERSDASIVLNYQFGD